MSINHARIEQLKREMGSLHDWLGSSAPKLHHPTVSTYQQNPQGERKPSGKRIPVYCSDGNWFISTSQAAAYYGVYKCQMTEAIHGQILIRLHRFTRTPQEGVAYSEKPRVVKSRRKKLQRLQQ